MILELLSVGAACGVGALASTLWRGRKAKLLVKKRRAMVRNRKVAPWVAVEAPVELTKPEPAPVKLTKFEPGPFAGVIVTCDYHDVGDGIVVSGPAKVRDQRSTVAACRQYVSALEAGTANVAGNKLAPKSLAQMRSTINTGVDVKAFRDTAVADITTATLEQAAREQAGRAVAADHFARYDLKLVHDTAVHFGHHAVANTVAKYREEVGGITTQKRFRGVA